MAASALPVAEGHQAEAAFRIHKSELSIRPVWHWKERRVLTTRDYSRERIEGLRAAGAIVGAS